MLDIQGDDNLSGPFQMRFSNDGKTWSDWEPFQGKAEKSWDLISYGGSDDTAKTARTIWAQIKDRAGNISAPISAQITAVLSWANVILPLPEGGVGMDNGH